jgi:PRC-barrel domain
MALYKIEEFDSDYQTRFAQNDIRVFDLYSKNEKIGSIEDILVDDSGQIRYLVVNIGLWIFGKRTLLPVGQARVDFNAQRANADNLTKPQVESLPAFTDQMVMDYDYEEQIRKSYRSSHSSPPAAFGVGYAGYDSAPATPNIAASLDIEAGYAGYDRETYTYDHDPSLYAMNELDHQHLMRYHEGRVANNS